LVWVWFSPTVRSATRSKRTRNGCKDKEDEDDDGDTEKGARVPVRASRTIGRDVLGAYDGRKMDGVGTAWTFPEPKSGLDKGGGLARGQKAV